VNFKTLAIVAKF